MTRTPALSLAPLVALAGASLATASQAPLDAHLAPRADWLAAAKEPAAFTSADDFDWTLTAGRTVILDTSHAVIRGSIAAGAEETRVVEGGVLRVRNLYVPAGAALVAQGPNPLVILASGDVRVDGRISVDGGDAPSVFTLDQPTLPRLGAPGQAGGGNGGTASRYIDRSTPLGGPGSGAFNQSADGGQGGESGWSPDASNFGVNRRAAGGGGGVFARDVLLPNGCVDQGTIGLDAESGFPGATLAFAATRPGERMPWGGRQGRGPFANPDPADDFWGALVVDEGQPGEHVVDGELATPWAGAGGGGGGDATRTLDLTYPPAQFLVHREDQGCGGGGGAGALLIFARGDVVLGPFGRLTADGGYGGGGENTNFVNRIGGGSGGGSGGHVVVQSLARIDLSAVAPGALAISARGGQGGAGADNFGGSSDGETGPVQDAKHVGVTGPNDLSDNPWIPPVPQECQLGQDVVRGAGGDGGPGVIQLHVTALGDILPPGGDPARIGEAVVPPPVGYDGAAFVGRLVPMIF